MEKYVVIEWVDPIGQTSWVSEEELMSMKPARAITVGVIIKEDEDNLIIASTKQVGQDEYGDVNVIPKALVKSRIHLGEIKTIEYSGRNASPDDYMD